MIRALALRTANGSSVAPADIIGLGALKPPTAFCRRVLVPLLGGFILFSLPVIALADAVSPSTLATACFTCHGTDGKSPGAIPSLHGKTAAYIEQQLKAFKADRRQVTLMNRIAKGYSDAEIEAIAQYLGHQ